MKMKKRVLALLLTAAMTVGMGVCAFAAGNHTITIESKTGGHTYQAYQVFGGTYDDTSKKLSDVT